MFFFSAKSGAFVVHVFLVEGLSRSLKFFLMSLFLSRSFSLSLLLLLSFFLFRVVCSVLSDTKKKKTKTHEKKCFSSVCAIGIFSQLFLSLSSLNATT